MKLDVIIIGGGAAGLFCAIEAGYRGHSVLVLEHNDRIGKKILISGGGRCNFTNLFASPDNYISENPHFCRSALSRYTAQDFVARVERHGIAYHEKTLGQLFCDESARQITGMLQRECEWASVKIQLNCTVNTVEKTHTFRLHTNQGVYECNALVIASGGISIAKIGATDFGYRIARQFNLRLTEIRPALVPLTLHAQDKSRFSELSGVSLDTIVSNEKASFRENTLITHRGISGPAILQISSYWREGEAISVNLLPEIDVLAVLEENCQSAMELHNFLSRWLSKRFAKAWCDLHVESKPLKRYSPKERQQIAHALQHWQIQPAGTEGFQKAEVTLGGVDTNELSPKTMESKKVSGLYFIGEVIDVTGWLGGYNFQWAWSSAHAAGQYV